MNFKSKFMISTILLCLISLVAIAKDQSNFSVKATEANSFVLQLTHVKEAQIQVTLKDVEGETLYNETRLQSSLDQQKYDLRKLPIGDYTLVVVYDGVIKIQPIKKRKDILEIKVEELQTIFQPVFRQHSGYLDLNMLCLSDLNISLKISDAEGNMIYRESVQPNGTLQKRFNLSMLDNGNYTFTVEVDDYVVNEEFVELIEWSSALAAL